MKTIRLALLVLTLSLLARPLIGAEEQRIGPGEIYFPNTDLTMVLQIYEQLAGLELVIDSRVRARTIDYRNPTSLSREEAVIALQQAMLKQAGIVITRLEDGNVSVTYIMRCPQHQRIGRIQRQQAAKV